MSSFNEPYEHDEKKLAKKAKKKAEEATKAYRIYMAVVDAQNGGTTNFSKKKMISLAAKDESEKKKFNEGSENDRLANMVDWNRACNKAIILIRSHYWEKENEADKRMFNFVRKANRYWFVPVTGDRGILCTNIIYEDYDNKMRGIQKAQEKIRTSLYFDLLGQTKPERIKLINDLKEQHLLENGE